ncbi:MAG: hypothetical protein LBM41_05855 [Ruminococcus sp.]|jgi:hypothetical protein|nr:hypothetical protein [Ruminococcus sp.]
MSAREMLKADVDYMPQEVVDVLGAIWMLTKKNYYEYEQPNAETLEALSDTDYNSYDNPDDQLKALSRFEDEEP